MIKEQWINGIPALVAHGSVGLETASREHGTVAKRILWATGLCHCEAGEWWCCGLCRSFLLLSSHSSAEGEASGAVVFMVFVS